MTYNDTARRSCSLIISASHIAIREGGHRALFERYNQEIGDRLKLDIGATDEETATLQGLAKDGSEILLRNRILRSPNQTIKLQILLANKYGIGAKFVGISLANLVSCNPPTGVDSSPPICSSGFADCSDELDDTLYGIGGGTRWRNLTNNASAETPGVEEDGEAVISGSFSKSCAARCTARQVLCILGHETSNRCNWTPCSCSVRSLTDR